MASEARHMSKLVEQLLALARNDLEREETAAKIVDVAQLAHDVCEEFLPVAAEKGLSITCKACEGMAQVMGNETDVRRLLLILLDNAVKHTESGSITVTVDSQLDGISISVNATGIGIEPTAIPKVFNRFWRADKVRSRSVGGAGLGLSLASQIVAKSDGTITVKSQVGDGSSVVVKLPPVIKVQAAASPTDNANRLIFSSDLSAQFLNSLTGAASAGMNGD